MELIIMNQGKTLILLITIATLQNNLAVSAQEDNLLNNPDFEDPFGSDDWFCNGGCSLERTSEDPQAGTYSGRVTERTEEWNGVSQNVPLEPDSLYYFGIWIKLLSQADGAMWHQIQLRVVLEYPEGNDVNIVSYLPYLKESQGWQLAGGDFYVDNRAISGSRVYVQISAPGETIDYQIDTAFLYQFYNAENDWKTLANQRINDIRKNGITINLSVTEDYEPSDLQLNLYLTRHDFPFGTAVKDDQIIGTDEDSLKYQQCFYENFKWSVLENALKWRQMEREQGNIIYPDEAIDTLLSNGIPVRGHCVFWGIADNNPDWLLELDGSEVLENMVRRMDYLVPRYEGKLVHWDVNNEQLHGSFYEEKINDPYITAWIFEQVKERDPNVTLFLNDFAIVREAAYTQALVNSANELLSLGADVEALGIQSHLRGFQNSTRIAQIMKRLEVVSTAGLPIWITELDISEVTGQNSSTRLADSYDDVLTLYYSHPLIQGILLWGFSDQYHSKPDAALFEGPDYVPNESGLRWQELMTQRWNTSAMFFPNVREESFAVRGFHGDYTVDIISQNNLISSTSIYLSAGSDLEVDIIV